MEDVTNDKFKNCEILSLPKEFFVANQKNFLDHLKKLLPNYERSSILLLKSGSHIYRYNTDVLLNNFLQESNFYYLSGVKEPDTLLLVDLNSEKFKLFLKFPNDDYKIWNYTPTLEEIEQKYGLETKYLTQLFETVNNINPTKIFYLEGSNTDTGVSYSKPSIDWPENLKGKVESSSILYEILATSRVRKTKEELEIIKYICDFTCNAHLDVFTMKKNNKYEREIESYFMDYCAQRFHTRFWSYPLCVMSGENSAILNYIENNKIMKDGELVLYSLGINFCGYNLDVTTTIPVNGKFSKSQKEIYDIIIIALEEIEKNVKPGIYWPDMQTLAERIIITELKRLKILNEYNMDEMLINRVCYYFMPHGIGQGI